MPWLRSWTHWISIQSRLLGTRWSEGLCWPARNDDECSSGPSRPTSSPGGAAEAPASWPSSSAPPPREASLTRSAPPGPSPRQPPRPARPLVSAVRGSRLPQPDDGPGTGLPSGREHPRRAPPAFVVLSRSGTTTQSPTRSPTRTPGLFFFGSGVQPDAQPFELRQRFPRCVLGEVGPQEEVRGAKLAPALDGRRVWAVRAPEDQQRGEEGRAHPTLDATGRAPAPEDLCCGRARDRRQTAPRTAASETGVGTPAPPVGHGRVEGWHAPVIRSRSWTNARRSAGAGSSGSTSMMGAMKSLISSTRPALKACDASS